MLFADPRFVALTALTWIVFTVANRRWRPTVLAAGGVVFYLLLAPSDATVILGLAAAVFLVPRRFGAAAALGVAATLIAFKIKSSADSTSAIPLGLSFLAFELMHLAIDRESWAPEQPTADVFAAWALFFPCRVSGPIRRFPDFASSLLAADPSLSDVYFGLVRTLQGLAKKFVLADVLAMTVAEGIGIPTAVQAWKVLVAFTFQIYLDFSAYSDIAIGVTRMFGIKAPENFDWPYLSRNIKEFWTRWHITLSLWIRDYVFIGVGRMAFGTPLRSSPTSVACLCYIVSFVTVGAWHGLAPHYLVWGLYQGALLSGYHVYRRTLGDRLARSPVYSSPVINALSTALTFVAVMVGYVFFLSADMHSALTMFGRLVGR